MGNLNVLSFIKILESKPENWELEKETLCILNTYITLLRLMSRQWDSYSNVCRAIMLNIINLFFYFYVVTASKGRSRWGAGGDLSPYSSRRRGHNCRLNHPHHSRWRKWCGGPDHGWRGRRGQWNRLKYCVFFIGYKSSVSDTFFHLSWILPMLMYVRRT